MKGRKSLAAFAAAGLMLVPVASQAGKRATVPVGLHLAPVAAVAAQAGVAGKRKSKKVEDGNRLIGSFFVNGLGLFANAAFAGGKTNKFASRGAN